MKSHEARSLFLKFFEEKGHNIVPSAPMVMKNDPTLLFTNAGMNQFKEYFLGISQPKTKRIADTQKCLRVSGKHNDLEEVGKDTYHHTMFEMLGNWSFGDYFKKEAIAWAWQLLTEVYGIDKNNLYVTIFEGSNDADNLKKDMEAFDFWKQHISEERILLGNKKDNFWEMGDQGPCGPCSEIHVDIRSDAEKQKINGATLVNQDHPQVVEIWNLVFIQYNRKANGALEELPNKHIDTGMGFERLCMVLQNKQSNYDTDIFTPIIKAIEELTLIPYGAGIEEDIAIRVIADHLRAVAFAIADGQLPSNTGAGYVIRRILRRAVRYGFTFLNQKEPFIHQLLPALQSVMQGAFPELDAQHNLIKNVIREEEQSFLNTLEQGLQLLEEVLKKSQGKIVDGSKAFELYDTFGFPIDLTTLILQEKGFVLDIEGFEKALQAQKNRSRKASEINKEDWVIINKEPNTEFIGYDDLKVTSKLVKYRKINSKKEGNQYQLVLDKTPFYPEGGGQIGDRGYLIDVAGNKTQVLSTKKENNEIIHLTNSLPSNLKEHFTAVVDQEKRRQTTSNHTATHLLHQALRSILGTHVEQKGSAVNEKYLRFDFSHFSKLTPEELNTVENFVNDRIAENIPLEEKRQVAMQVAIDAGAMALFGEKYGDKVRTIRFGDSIELCGGTHVPHTGVIWHFKIMAESAVAAGIRRIEAITSNQAKLYFLAQASGMEEIKQILNNPKVVPQAVADLRAENAALKKELDQLKADKAKGLTKQLEQKLQVRGDFNFIAEKVDVEAAGMKDLLFELGQKNERLVALLGAIVEGKALLSLYISKSLVAEKNLDAGHIIRALGKHIQGGGGGQPFFATAGGKNPEGLDKALEAIGDLV